MGRTTTFDVDGIKRGEWAAEEDGMLVAYITKYGLGEWRSLPARAGLQRCGKSCRLRWLNYLRPGIKRGKFTSQEEEEIIKLHSLLGNRWAAIAKQMPNRTDNDIKNHWNSCLKKRLVRNGIDPMTHEPIVTVNTTSYLTTSSSQPSFSSSSTSSSSTGFARILNMVAAGISSRRHGLDMIKTVIMSEPRQEKMINKEEDEVIGCFMEIDEDLNTSSFDENLNTSPFDENLNTMPFDENLNTTPFNEKLSPFDENLSTTPFNENLGTTPFDENLGTTPFNEKLSPFDGNLSSTPFDENLRTTPFDEIPCKFITKTSFVAFDDYTSIEPYSLYQSEFYDETDQFSLFLF